MALNPLSARDRQKALTALNFASVSDLLADREQYSPGQILFAGQEYKYEVAPPAASDHHLTTAGGAKLYVRPVDGSFYVEAFGEPATEASVRNAFNAAKAATIAVPYAVRRQATIFTLKCSSRVTVANTIAFNDGGAAFYGLSIDFKNATLVGVSGGNLGAAAGSSTVGMVLTVSLQNAEIDPPFIDGGRFGSCLDILNCTSSRVSEPRTVRPAANGYGIRVRGNCSNLQMKNPIPWEFSGQDPEYSDFANFSAIGLWLDAEDFDVWGGMPAWSKRPIVFSPNASLVRVHGAHPFNGKPGGSDINRIAVESESPYGNMMFNCYFDNGKIIDHGGNLIIQGGYFLNLPGAPLVQDPVVEVRCTAGQNGQSPPISNIQGLRVSVGYLPSLDGLSDWAGDYSGVPYSGMRGQGGQADAIKTRYRISQSPSTSVPHESHYRPGGSFTYTYKVGADEAYWQFNPVSGSFLVGKGANLVGMRPEGTSDIRILAGSGGTVLMNILPTSSTGLAAGSLWCDTAAGNVIKQVR